MSDTTRATATESRIYLGLGICAAALLIGYTLTRPHPPHFDEVYHLSRASDWRAASSISGWLTADTTSAAGPFYGLFYQAFLRGTGWPIPGIRIPNLAFLLYTMAVLGAVCARRQRAVAAFGLLALPMTWVAAGMALTEMPAIAMQATAVYAADWLARHGEADARRRAIWWTVFGIAIGLAVSMRQTVLSCCPALLLLAARRWRDGLIGAFVLGLGLAPMLWVFHVWGGLVPASQAHVSAGLRWDHALRAFAYVGIASLLLAPRGWQQGWRWGAVGAVLALVAAALCGWVAPTTLTSVLRWVGPTLASAVAKALAAGFVAVGGAYAALLARALWQSRETSERALIVGVALSCLGCAAITHQFSSRYATLALPFLLPLLAPAMDFGAWARARFVVGAALGFAALHSYYVFSN